MNNATRQIVDKAWNFAHVLRDGGLSYMAYTEQITFLLFLKMAHEQTLPPHKRAPIVPPGSPHASRDSRHFDVTGIAIGRAQAQYILSAMPGSAESAPNRRHRPEARKEQN